MSEPAVRLDHIMRAPLPWRAGSPLTECGRDTASLEAVLTLDGFRAKIRRDGQTRAKLTSCVTCWTAAERYVRWADDPTAVVGRECGRLRWEFAGGQPNPDRVRMNAELRVLAALVDRHRDEFDSDVAALIAAPTLDAARAARARRRPAARR